MELIEYTKELKESRAFSSAKECAKIIGVSERVLNYSIKNTKEINGFFYQYKGREISFKEGKYKCVAALGDNNANMNSISCEFKQKLSNYCRETWQKEGGLS